MEELNSSNDKLSAQISDMKAEDLLKDQTIETLNLKLEETEYKVSKSNKASIKSQQKLNVWEPTTEWNYGQTFQSVSKRIAQNQQEIEQAGA